MNSKYSWSLLVLLCSLAHAGTPAPVTPPKPATPPAAPGEVKSGEYVIKDVQISFEGEDESNPPQLKTDAKSNAKAPKQKAPKKAAAKKVDPKAAAPATDSAPAK
ncbi:MAG: hypothetical protein JST16_14885 [Bdellovibrionales bacterium]|nr:hypothetical protein [Bdellovibrionales bacterium]